MKPTIKQQLQQAQAEVKRLKSLARTKREPIAGTFGGYVQSRREAIGCGLREMANRCDMQSGLLCQIETGHTSNPTLETITKLAAAFKEKPSQFLKKFEDYIA